jgi:hypothetical protein
MLNTIYCRLNKKNKESTKVDIKARPDGGMSLTEQLQQTLEAEHQTLEETIQNGNIQQE